VRSDHTPHTPLAGPPPDGTGSKLLPPACLRKLLLPTYRRPYLPVVPEQFTVCGYRLLCHRRLRCAVTTRRGYHHCFPPPDIYGPATVYPISDFILHGLGRTFLDLPTYRYRFVYSAGWTYRHVLTCTYMVDCRTHEHFYRFVCPSRDVRRVARVSLLSVCVSVSLLSSFNGLLPPLLW